MSGSILKNHFKKLLTKLGQVWNSYSGYKPLGIPHNEIYRNIVKENELVEYEDIQEENELIQVHNVYTHEFKDILKLFENLVVENGAPTWDNVDGLKINQ